MYLYLHCHLFQPRQILPIPAILLTPLLFSLHLQLPSSALHSLSLKHHNHHIVPLEEQCLLWACDLSTLQIGL